MSKNNGLLAVIENRFKDLDWCCRDRVSSYLGRKGAYTALNAHTKGFEIRIVMHGYNSQDYPDGVPGEIRCRRRLVTKKTRRWIEISVVDEMARFGRRMIVDREVFLPRTAEHARLERLFAQISSSAHYFSPNDVTRLSKAESLANFCERLSRY